MLESEEDEKKVQEVLARLKAEVSRRRLLSTHTSRTSTE